MDFDGVLYDSFNLRVVYERDRTGFEESKESPVLLSSNILSFSWESLLRGESSSKQGPTAKLL